MFERAIMNLCTVLYGVFVIYLTFMIFLLISSITFTVYGEKYCFANGTWNHNTNYVPCASAPIYRRRHRFHVIVLAISIVISFPAVVVFFMFKKLRILRLSLYRNLLMAIIIKNVLTIMSKELVLLESLRPVVNGTYNILEESPVSCKVLAFLENWSKNVVFTCMLVVGYYLHKTIARVFSGKVNVIVLHSLTLGKSIF